MDVDFPIPTTSGSAEALAVLRRWLPAFLEGRRADEDLYADRVTTWHNIGEREVEVQRTPSRTRIESGGAQLRIEGVRVRVFDGGWVLQSTTAGTSAGGEPVRIPSCLVASVEKGRITRFEEYADSAATRPLLG